MYCSFLVDDLCSYHDAGTCTKYFKESFIFRCFIFISYRFIYRIYEIFAHLFSVTVYDFTFPCSPESLFDRPYFVCNQCVLTDLCRFVFLCKRGFCWWTKHPEAWSLCIVWMWLYINFTGSVWPFATLYHTVVTALDLLFMMYAYYGIIFLNALMCFSHIT